jgi:hypothetical protein
MKVGVSLDVGDHYFIWDGDNSLELPEAPRQGDLLAIWRMAHTTPGDVEFVEGRVKEVRWQVGGGPTPCHVELEFLEAVGPGEFMDVAAFAEFLDKGGGA